MTEFPQNGDNFWTRSGPGDMRDVTDAAYRNAIRVALERGDREKAELLVAVLAELRTEWARSCH